MASGLVWLSLGLSWGPVGLPLACPWSPLGLPWLQYEAPWLPITVLLVSLEVQKATKIASRSIQKSLQISIRFWTHVGARFGIKLLLFGTSFWMLVFTRGKKADPMKTH